MSASHASNASIRMALIVVLFSSAACLSWRRNSFGTRFRSLACPLLSFRLLFSKQGFQNPLHFVNRFLIFSGIEDGAALVLAVVVADSVEECVRLMVCGISPGGMASDHSRLLVLQR